MIKSFRIFEEINSDLKVGDYVIMRSDCHHYDIINFVNNNIGKVINIVDDGVTVLYFNVPDYLEDNFFGVYDGVKGRFKGRLFNIKQVVYYSSSLKELKLKISSSKYNL